MSRCPHCSREIEPPPKRSKNCPHCKEPIVLRRGQLLTPKGAEEFDARASADRDKREVEKKIERFREGRQRTREAIREAKKSGVVVGFKPLISEDACKVCRAVRGKFIPLSECSPESLPPYEDCEFEGECESTFVEVLDIDRPRGSRKKSTQQAGGGKQTKAGCLGVMLMVVFAWTVLGMR
jgi:hypothetical protein